MTSSTTATTASATRTAGPTLQPEIVTRPTARYALALARIVAFVDRAVLDTYVRSAAWGVLGLAGAGTRGHARARPTTGLALVGGGVLLLAGVTALALWGIA